jgi:hypothetical protein
MQCLAYGGSLGTGSDGSFSAWVGADLYRIVAILMGLRLHAGGARPARAHGRLTGVTTRKSVIPCWHTPRSQKIMGKVDHELWTGAW